jgi:hypothetical protein
VPRLRVDLATDAPADTKVLEDGAELGTDALGVARPVDPGEHIVTRSPRRKEGRVTVTLRSGESKRVAAAPGDELPEEPVAAATAAPPEPAGSGLRTGGIVAFVAGGAALGVGSITGILAINKHDSLVDQCNRTGCTASDIAPYHTLASVSTAGFIVAGVGAATGALLFLVSSKRSSSARISPLVGPGVVGATGRF